MTKRLTKLIALALVFVMCAAVLTACPGKGPGVVTPATFKQAEYNTTTVVMPSNWNELTYTDGNDTQILGYIGSSFFDYDYKFENDKKYNEDGSINVEGIVPGAYTTNFSAATKLEDVTSTVDAKWGYTDEHKASGGYAWKITLRDDLKWHDGTPITAEDFEYSMQQTLDPEFMNYRANTYYDTLMIKNAKNYFYQNQAGVYETLASMYDSIAAAQAAGEKVFVKPTNLFSGIETFVDEAGNPMPEWIPVDATLYADPADWAAGTAAQNGLDGAWIVATYGAAYLEPGKSYETSVAVYVENQIRHVEWSEVGMYAIPEENAIVVCLDKSYALIQEDGNLSYQAAYYMAGLPLVKRDLYEACKQEPAEGATLKTSNYNSSLETTASWGPYMLVEFEAGSHYRLEKNLNWYGWGMEQYKNQYNVTAINTRKVEEATTQWMGFLAGNYDDSSLDTFNIDEYLDSKYVKFSPGDGGMYAVQLYSNLPVLKASGNNNGILAIDEFRQAINLALDRSDVIEKVWPGTAAPLFGLLSPQYYYDIENSPYLEDGGNYRNNPVAMKGVLRAYGYVEAADGTWSINNLSGLSLEDAYSTLTGYNPELAKEKFAEAVEKLLADTEYYGYDPSKKVTIIFGASADTDKQRFRANYMNELIANLAKGTALEGQIEVVFDASAAAEWSDAFRSGKTQIGFGYGFRGNLFNPFDIIGAFVNPDDDLNYHMYWDTSAIDLTLTLPEGNYEGAGQTHTMSAQNWFYCLNGLAESEGQEYTYDWGAGKADVEARIIILSALEELALQTSRTIMLITDAGGSFLGAKFSYFNDEYNVFMGFGGLRYIVVNYTDAEWTEYVESQNGDLSAEYKKSE